MAQFPSCVQCGEAGTELPDLMRKGGGAARSQTRRFGTLFVVVGPSGAGKDTLMNWVRMKLCAKTSIGFVQRTISRSGDKGNEDHQQVTPERFAEMQQAGCFSVTWTAHGLHYGVPARLHADLASGKCMILNGSRYALDEVCREFRSVHIVHVDVDRTELERRLTLRARETSEQVSKRLSRANVNLPTGVPVTRLDNTGPIEHAGNVFLAIIETHVTA